MGYSLDAGQKAPLIDQNGAPIPTGVLRAPDGSTPPFGTGSPATIQDDGAGNAECVGNHEGTITFNLTDVRRGESDSHEVTVNPAPGLPFSWTLGEASAR